MHRPTRHSARAWRELARIQGQNGANRGLYRCRYQSGIGTGAICNLQSAICNRRGQISENWLLRMAKIFAKMRDTTATSGTPTLASLSPPAGRVGSPAEKEHPDASPVMHGRLLADLRDTPLAIGLYSLLARLYLVHQAPIPLSAADIQRYDPTLCRGAIVRALARLTQGGWLLEEARAGYKTCYTPTWGA